jgi:hypothetical protein
MDFFFGVKVCQSIVYNARYDAGNMLIADVKSTIKSVLVPTRIIRSKPRSV